ncbi:OLC1v1014360C2 [Oldenlandia corymbosa var. corymbosa]|uniref:Protein TIFY n=1 Tax=Oldenlandia corymbosa var. corymbosa TaxID=529605 RepID=A0AAV1E319_OLDCO|nr:OLC1v1014360C2 [Oldenlandia corymbosa var. corymbosa]
MEQDFMGLRTVKVKKEVPEETNDPPAPVRGPMMRWSFPNKVPTNSPFFTLNSTSTVAAPGSKDDKPKTGFEALASTGLVTITTTEAVDSTQKSFSSVMQKNMVPDNQGGAARYSMTSYLAKPFDSQSLHRPHDARTLPLPTSLTTPVHQSFISSVGQIGSTTSSAPVVNSSPLVGTTELRSTSKPSGAPAQLTIFYAGSVCVYDDISPEKAQAIMLLAGNAPSLGSNSSVPAAPVQSVQPVPAVQASVVRPSIIDSFVVNQSHISKPSVPSSIPMTCHSSAASLLPTDATPLRAVLPADVSPLSGVVATDASPLRTIFPPGLSSMRTVQSLASPPSRPEPSKQASTSSAQPKLSPAGKFLNHLKVY